MNRLIGLALIVAIYSIGPGAVSGKGGAEFVPSQSVPIRLYNQAQISDRVLDLATGESDESFSKARIRINWAFPSIQPPQDQGIDMTSAAFLRSVVRPYVAVRITRGTPAGLLPGALGFALPFAQTGANVVIFYDRVETLAHRESRDVYVALGYAMAHEIGHVLLRSSGHSRSGLMQAQVTSETLRLAALGLLAFTHEETSRMRARGELLRVQQVREAEEPYVGPVALNPAGSE